MVKVRTGGETTMNCSQAVTVATADRAHGSAQETPDEALILSIATGDKQALQVLFGRHNVRVYRFVLRFLNDEAAAEDLVSEVFLDVWRQANHFEVRSQVSTWLLAMARNKALSARRRQPAQELDDRVAELVDPADNAEVTMQRKQRNSILADCLTQLSAAHREIIDLVYYQEKSIDEVAEIIGIPHNTVKTRMFYARKRIAELMNGKGLDRAFV
jgi:RNA polymerase sigma-70 factor (ECF subfamily)